MNAVFHQDRPVSPLTPIWPEKSLSTMPCVAELASETHAIPSEYREGILHAAVNVLFALEFSHGYLTDWYALHLRICFNAWCPPGLKLHALACPSEHELQERLRLFSRAKDQAQVALALCDLLGFLSATATVGSPLHPWFKVLGGSHDRAS